jgi:hypothetical protein
METKSMTIQAEKRYTYFSDLSVRLYVGGPEALLDKGTPGGWKITLLTWDRKNPYYVRVDFEKEGSF